MKRPLSLCLLLVSACATSRDRSLTVGQLVAERRYEAAVQLAAEHAEEHPDDPEARAAHRVATAALLMQRGREAFYEGELQEAAVFFDEAFDTAPDVPQTSEWKRKIHDEIADEKLGEAIRLHALDELEEAVEAYEEVIANRPDDLRAQEGLGRALLQINYREGQGKRYYNEGVRNLNDYFLHEARSKFGYTSLYWGDDKKVERRSEQVRELLAGTRVQIALNFEQEGQYAAAKNEFRLALLLVEDHPTALEGYQRCKIEAEAARLLSEAEMLIHKREFGEARSVLAEGRQLTEQQRERFAAMESRLEDARFEALYERAVSLEADYQFEAAVEAYDTLLDEAQFYLDALSRRETLLDFIAHAEDLYARAMEETDPEERLALLEEIEIFWPEYEDLQERLAELRDE